MGIWPFNPAVITADMMAPSKETSCKSHLPIPPATPVRVVAELLQKLSLGDGFDKGGRTDDDAGSEAEGEVEASEDEEGDMASKGTVVVNKDAGVIGVNDGGNAESVDGNSKDIPIGRSMEAIRNTIKKLSDGALAELVSSQPMTSKPELQHCTTHPIAPMAANNALNITPTTLNERLLLAALRESEACEEFL